MSGLLWDVAAVSTYDFLSAEYRALFAHSTATVFQSPLWLERLYRRVAAELAAEPLIILIRERGTGRLAALLPLIVRRQLTLRVAEFADFGVSDYCAPVCDLDFVSTLRNDETIQSQLRERLQSCDLLIIQKVREETLPAFELLGQTRRSELPFTAHATSLSAPYAVWREANISPSQRRFLDTKRRWLTKRGTLTTSSAESKQQFHDVLNNIKQFRDYRFRETGAFDILKNNVFAQFYREVAEEAPPARGYNMTMNGTTVCAAFGLVRDKTLHLVLSGFDFLNYRNASVGLLIIEDIIEDCIKRGETSLDLTIGDQLYKREFGTRETTMWSIWLGISLTGRVVAHLLSRSRRLRQMVRRLTRRPVIQHGARSRA
ncbi:MAG TPA: GNAT family N-acetyltransferase [Afipia sp.]